MVEEHMKALFGQQLSAWVDVYVARRNVAVVETAVSRRIDTMLTPVTEAVQFLICFLTQLQRSPRKLEKPLELY